MKKKYKLPKNLAKQKIEELFIEAKALFKKNPKQANRCVDKARKIGRKNKIRISSKLQRQFCKHCYSYLVPGINCRVRNQNKKMVYYCLNCKKYMRFPIKKK